MGMKLYWTEFSKKELKTIFNFYKDKVNIVTSKKIIENIVDSVEVLVIYPEIGMIDPKLSKNQSKIRFIISTNYKILYKINNDKNRIEILDIFDTRQNPNKIARNIMN